MFLLLVFTQEAEVHGLWCRLSNYLTLLNFNFKEKPLDIVGAVSKPIRAVNQCITMIRSIFYYYIYYSSNK